MISIFWQMIRNSILSKVKKNEKDISNTFRDIKKIPRGWFIVPPPPPVQERVKLLSDGHEQIME